MERDRGGRPRHPDILTPAEWRVLEELQIGGTNAEIAVRLGVSPDAVKYHISNMLGKLDLADRHGLAAWSPEPRARRLAGLLTVPSTFSSLGRPLLWAGGALSAVAVAVLVASLLIALGDDAADTPSPTATAPVATPTPSVTATTAVSPTATTESTPRPTAACGNPSPAPNLLMFRGESSRHS